MIAAMPVCGFGSLPAACLALLNSGLIKGKNCLSNKQEVCPCRPKRFAGEVNKRLFIYLFSSLCRTKSLGRE